MLTYIHTRSVRQESFQASTSERELERESPEYRKELRSYLGRERVLLRKRRTKLKVDQFRIIAQVRLVRPLWIDSGPTEADLSSHCALQVGQGGYGSVYLARKADTGEVCALKKMKKKTLAKMDEVRYAPFQTSPLLC